MKKRYGLSLFIFRRDLRIEDNTALMAACDESERVIPCFIFDDRQIKNNPYFSQPAFGFMLNSLKVLQAAFTKHDGHLYIFEGQAETIVEKLLMLLPIDAVFFNRDYTPFSRARDQALSQLIEKNNRSVYALPDALLCEPESILKSDGSPYVVYTAFAKKAREHAVRKPAIHKKMCFYQDTILMEQVDLLIHLAEKNKISVGGRSEALAFLDQLSRLTQYDEQRNIPALDATSHLSAHHKFGTISIRESFQAIVNQLGQSTLINELYWRDFFTHIGFHFPHVFSGPFHKRFQKIAWSTNETHFQKWCEGKTGFPIVDAGMRELNATGLMHNRVRMITASFLVKDLHINWQWGERYFATRLRDYDPAVNNGNWQWAASTGCDAQPYFRIFNPWLQQKRFDPDGEYVKRWLPELRGVDSRELYQPSILTSYYPPIVDHATAGAKAKLLFQVIPPEKR